MPASDSLQSDGSGGRPVTVIVPVSPMGGGAEGSALTGRYDRVLRGDLLTRVCVRCGAEGTKAGRLRCGKRLSRPFKMFLIGMPLIVGSVFATRKWPRGFLVGPSGERLCEHRPTAQTAGRSGAVRSRLAGIRR